MNISGSFTLRRVIILLLAIGACVCAAAGTWLCIAINLYYQPDIVAASLTHAARRNLGATLEVESIETGLLSGIQLRNMTLHVAGTRVTCEQAQLRCSLLALGFKRLVLREVALAGASLTAAGRSSPRPPVTTARRLDVLVLPSALQISTSRATFGPCTLDNISLRADDISVFMPFTIHGAATVADAPLARVTLSARVSIARRTCSATISGRDLPAALLRALTGNGTEWQEGTADVNLQAEAAWNRPIQLDGTLTLADARVFIPPATPELPAISCADLDAALDFSATLDPTTSALTILRLEGSLLESPLTGSGTLRQRGRRLDGDAALQLPDFDLGRLSDRLSLDGPAALQHLRIDGVCDLQLRIDSQSSRRSMPGLVITFKGNPITLPLLGQLRPRIWGEVGIDPTTIRLANLRLGTSELSVTLAGDIASYWRWPPRSSVRVISSDMHFDTLLGDPAVAAQYEIGPIDLGGLFFAGPINLGDIGFLGIPLGSVQGAYRLADNQVQIDSLQGTVGTGRFVLDAQIDLGVKGLDYYGRLRLDAAPLRLMTPLVGPLPPELRQAVLSGTCAVKGGGTAPGRMLAAVRGDAMLSVNGLAVTGRSLAPQLARYIPPDRLQAITMESAQFDLQLRNARIACPGIVAGHPIELLPRGEIMLDGALDMRAELHIDPAVLDSAGTLVRYLPRDDGWVSLPLAIGGTLANPQVQLAEDTMQYLLQKTLPNMLKDLLRQ